jgi:LuxR family maltose regulon positive regulatory protein
LIERPRLLEELDGAGTRIIALIAPAGCGKSTLARQWVLARNIPHAWYTIGPEGFDVAAVSARIAAALSELIPGVGERMLTRLSVSSDPEADAALLAEILARDITDWPADARLVVDDYQALSVSGACERFFATLVHEAPLRLLVASRKRPRWARSRLRLYGELFEIGREELEMTPEEASKVLAPVKSEAQRRQLVELCHGWPAVLGLAARSTGARVPSEKLLPGLYDYFAEEMLLNVSTDLRRFLCQVSAAPCLTRDLLERIGGAGALELAAEAKLHGFFSSIGESSEPSLHPLLRAFLEQRLEERSDRTELVDELADALLDAERWDDVWQLIRDFERADLLPRLIERSLPTLLDGSRVPALSSWIEYGRERGVVDPLLDLAEAEVAFFSGHYVRAYAFALQATHHFRESSSLQWRAHAIAARSAHFCDSLESGIDHARKARVVSPNSQAAQHCLWVEFLCTIELESPRCFTVLDRLREYRDGLPDTTARLAQAEFLVSQLYPFKQDSRTQLADILPLLDRVHPQIRTSVEGLYGDHLVQLARYADAEPVLSNTWHLLSECGIDLALSSVYCVRANNAIGLRRYRHAELLLDSAVRTSASETGSIPTLVLALREMVHVLKRDLRNDISDQIDPSSSKAWRGLAFAVESLKAACRDDVDLATRLMHKAEDTTINTETRTLCAFIRVIIALQIDPQKAPDLCLAALSLAEDFQHWNQFVWAYRAYPRLLTLATSDPQIMLAMRPVLISALDISLAKRYGISLTQTRRDHHIAGKSLTRREREVLQLVADGLTNREIAGRLYISEVTVKVHLRHIYEKLGVRNRMEAALHAVYAD